MDDPTKVKSVMMSLNQQIPPGIHDMAVRDMIADLLPHDHAKLGCMVDGRWDALVKQLRDVNFLPASFAAKQAYDGTLVPGC